MSHVNHGRDLVDGEMALDREPIAVDNELLEFVCLSIRSLFAERADEVGRVPTPDEVRSRYYAAVRSEEQRREWLITPPEYHGNPDLGAEKWWRS